MSGFVKVCGLTDAAAVEAALAAGVDAIGFVFAKSVRQVTPERARELAAPARGRALCVAVTQHPDATQLAGIFDVFRPDVLQTDAGDLRGITLPAGVAAWPVLRDSALAAGGVAVPPGRFLFEGARSGTGQVADWGRAREVAEGGGLILAGGLHPDNVAEGIHEVRPFGVDVSSGVEDAPGHKSPALVAAFVERARAAFAARPTTET